MHVRSVIIRTTQVIDHVLYNGHILTLNSEEPQVQALLIRNDRIVAAGSDDEILRIAASDATRENLQGRLVLPGLTDAHIHWQWLTRALHSVDLFEVPTKAEAVRRVAEYVMQNETESWILGGGWTQDLWEDGAFPTAADLDSATQDYPTYLQAKSGHAAWVNSAALRLAGIDASIEDPPGGQIIRDRSGQPTGILLETAMMLVADLIPDVSSEQLAQQMKRTQALAHEAGLTGIHDYDNPSCLAALQVLREQNALSVRVVKQINKAWLDDALKLGIRWNFGDDWIRFGGLKLFADGALGPRTALMVDPYEGDPNNRGIAVTGKEDMVDMVSRASAAGLPSTIHAIGDRAVHDVLDVYETVRAQERERGISPDQRRHRIEHVQLIHPDDRHRLAELDIIASMQPIHATSDMEVADAFWGERSEWAYNARLQLDQNVRIAFGSDAPVESFHPLAGVYAAVARRRADGYPGPDGWYPELRLTLEEALRGYTTGPAYAAGMEDRLGQLMPGYYADLIVLDRDITELPAEALLETKVLGTMVAGVWRYGGVDG